MCSKIVIAGSVAGVGLLLAALGGGLGWGLFPSIIEDEIVKKLVLAEGSTSYENWVTLPQPLEFRVYIMEVANADAVHAGLEKPFMVERGPYVYNEYKAKENLIWSEDGNTVEFEQRSTFEFNPELSGDFAEDDEVTVLNAALIGMIMTPEILDQKLVIDQMVAGYKFLFNNPTSVFSKVKVRDLLFDGIAINCADKETDPGWSLLCNLLIEVQASLPPALRYDETTGNFYYSFFHHKDNATDGHFKVMTGKSDIMKTGEIIQWENSDKLDFWSGPECNVLRGSDATIFPPFNNKDTKIWVFTTDLCRSIYLSFDKEIKHEGIRGYRYIVDPVQLGNVSDRPDNYCYCPPNGACLKAGAMDLTTCFDGPVILTLPHFYSAAPEYLDMVDNLKPSKEEHEIYVDMEVHSGAPMGAGRRVQFNMMIKPIRGYDITANLPEAIVPLLWINEALTLNEENTNILKDELISKLKIVDGIRWGLIGVGAAAVVAGAAMFFIWHGSSRKQRKQRKMSRDS